MAMAFQPGKARGVQYDLDSRLDPPPLPELGDRARRHDQRIERGAVDAAIDDPNARPRRVHALADQLRRVERVGDHAVAARHDAVIGGFDRPRIAIGAVIGCDERPVAAARGEQRAPRRCAASRMDEIDAAFDDQPLQAPSIRKHGERILARDGKGDDLATGLPDRRRQASACRDDQGRRASAGERLGDLDGRLLASPGIEARHDLQYGHRCHAL